ncbi:MAG TPA: GNAT family N-acetyltransferase [Candidatus Baltobacteraceae bacterium]|nr:GNAT family N-acetyltransferase [Candidatus Baltobacteraceae bacterium]
MRLQEIPPDVYATAVLPQTASLWAGRRDFDTYVADTLEIAHSRYGRRHYRTVGFFDDRTLLASFKRYERAMHDGSRRLHAFGIGAVFTPPERRGRGYATAMLASALDQARIDGYDVAYLFSDVRPQFYAAIGFSELPSREISLRADTLPSLRLEVARLEERDWPGVARCFDMRVRGGDAFARTPLVWEWIRTRIRQQAEHPSGQQANLVVRHGRGVGAYVLGVRVLERDAYAVDEFGFADERAALLVPALLRAAAGDLRRVVGWLPPKGARELLPRGSARKRRGAILMMAPLSRDGSRLIKNLLTISGDADCCWATDHI